MLDAEMGRPAHAAWYAARVSSPPALQALTYRLGAPTHPCNECAFSSPGRCRFGQRTYTIYCFWILDAKVARPPHATWYVGRIRVPPTLQALTCRLNAPAHPWNERAFSYPRHFCSGNTPTQHNDLGSLMPRWPGRLMPLSMCIE